ncbi:hypothetical protein X801_02030 [Opisthorchis viverrini]|uniref:Uncharacterized protein n=1 Tax=Opisthorchis viverrini TaxID=6198 RepID=A0A1S8X5Z9_OPIVI|nr:hypothetical protein X801_02030 [Opisthorchis viverrini]
MNFGRKTAGGQLGIHDESKDVKYVQARMSQGRHGIEEDPYWDQQSTFEGDARQRNIDTKRRPPSCKQHKRTRPINTSYEL